MSTDRAITTLNQLIALAVDGVEGFRLAAERVEGAQVKALLAELAAEREVVVAALQMEVRRLGGEPEYAGTLAGIAHRAFTSVKTAVMDAEPAGLLDEILRGESYAIERFEQAVEEADLPPEVRSLVETQLSAIGRARESVVAVAALRA